MAIECRHTIFFAETNDVTVFCILVCYCLSLCISLTIFVMFTSFSLTTNICFQPISHCIFIGKLLLFHLILYFLSHQLLFCCVPLYLIFIKEIIQKECHHYTIINRRNSSRSKEKSNQCRPIYSIKPAAQ